MIRTMNELPVAVHHKSGGDARVRCGGLSILLNNATSGSFQVTGGTRCRISISTRTNAGLFVFLGYQGPATIANAEMLVQDLGTVYEDVPEGTSIYWALMNPSDCSPVSGGPNDYIYVTFYN